MAGIPVRSGHGLSRACLGMLGSPVATRFFATSCASFAFSIIQSVRRGFLF